MFKIVGLDVFRFNTKLAKLVKSPPCGDDLVETNEAVVRIRYALYVMWCVVKYLHIPLKLSFIVTLYFFILLQIPKAYTDDLGSNPLTQKEEKWIVGIVYGTYCSTVFYNKGWESLSDSLQDYIGDQLGYLEEKHLAFLSEVAQESQSYFSTNSKPVVKYCLNTHSTLTGI